MTLQDKIEMINDMIRENPEATIKDYLDLLKEIEAIEKATQRILSRIKFFELKRA